MLDVFLHVNHAVYLNLFEEARWQFITDNGYGLARIQATQKGPIILDAHLQYRAELAAREKIHVESLIYPYAHKVGRLEQNLYKGNGVLSCKAEFLFGFFDMQARKLLAPTSEWLGALGLPPN